MRTATRLLFLSVVAVGLSCGLDSKPAAPTDLKAAISANGAIALSWSDQSDNETHFVVERGPNDFEFAEIALLRPGTVAYEDYGIEPSTTYFYRVRANNEAGLSPPSLTVQIDMPAAVTVPVTPARLTAVNTGHDVRLSWLDNSRNETGFTIERGTIAFGGTGVLLPAWLQIGTVGPNVTAFTDAELMAGMTYSYRVAATNSLGSSGYSNTATVTVPPDLTLPNAPVNLVVETGFNGVTLHWKDMSRTELGFRIQHATVEGRWMIAGETPANVTTLSFSGGLAMTGTYRVCAFNAAGESRYTNVAEPGLPEVIAAPNAPTGLGYFLNADGIVLHWKDNSVYETGYLVERAFFLGRYTPIATLDANETRFVDESRFPHHRWYRVRAFNAYGYSGYSNVLEIGGPPVLLPPEAPTGLFGHRIDSTVRLGWTDNANNEIGFRIERNIAATKWVQVGYTKTNVTRFDDDAVMSHGPIFYRVCATNLAGDSAYSNTIIVYGQ